MFFDGGELDGNGRASPEHAYAPSARPCQSKAAIRGEGMPPGVAASSDAGSMPPAARRPDLAAGHGRSGNHLRSNFQEAFSIQSE